MESFSSYLLVRRRICKNIFGLYLSVAIIGTASSNYHRTALGIVSFPQPIKHNNAQNMRFGFIWAKLID